MIKQNEKEKASDCRNKNEKFLKTLQNVESNDNKHSNIVTYIYEIENVVKTCFNPLTVSEIANDFEDENFEVLVKVVDYYMRRFSEIIGIYLKIEWDVAKSGN